MIALARQAIAIVCALPRLPEFCRHLAELELRVGQAELDIDDFDRDLGSVEAIVQEHHMGQLTTARGTRGGQR